MNNNLHDDLSDKLSEDVLQIILSYCSAEDARNFFLTSKTMFSMCGNMFWTNLFKYHYKDIIINPEFIQSDVTFKKKFLNWSKILSTLKSLKKSNIHNIAYTCNILNCYDLITHIISNGDLSKLDINLPLARYYIIERLYVNLSIITLFNKNKYKQSLLKYILTDINVYISENVLKIIVDNNYLELLLNNNNINTISDIKGFKHYELIVNKVETIDISLNNRKLLLTHPKITDDIKKMLIKRIIDSDHTESVQFLFDIFGHKFLLENYIFNYAYDIHHDNLNLIISVIKKIYNDDDILVLFKHNIGHFIRTGLHKLMTDIPYTLSSDKITGNLPNICNIYCENKKQYIDNKLYLEYIIKNKLSLVDKIKFLEMDNYVFHVLHWRIISILLNDITLKYNFNKNKAYVLTNKNFILCVKKYLYKDGICQDSKTVFILKDIIKTLDKYNKLRLLRDTICSNNYEYLNILLSVHTFKENVINKWIHLMNDKLNAEDKLIDSNIIFNHSHLHILLKLIEINNINNSDFKIHKQLVDHVVISIYIPNYKQKHIKVFNLHTPLEELCKIYRNNILNRIWCSKVLSYNISLDLTKSLYQHNLVNDIQLILI